MLNKSIENISLTLFFTAGMGLSSWADSGNLDREMALYDQLISSGLGGVNLVTYGGKKDHAFIGKTGDINLLPVNWHSRQSLTALHVALKYAPQLLKTDVLKTNQMRGAQIPVWIKKVFRKKLIVRCGFLHGFFTRMQTDDQFRIREAENLERITFNEADLVVVTSGWQREMVLDQYDLSPEKVKVIPNYVLTDLFKPEPSPEKKYDLIFIGRGDKQKNLLNLFKSLEMLKERGENYSLLLAGSCCKNEQLRVFVDNKSLDVTFYNNVPNIELPRLLNQAKVFILPSFYEGHPKALLEAMSCGLACIGARTAGIKEEIKHFENGCLCETDEQSIAEAVSRLMADEALRTKLGKAAREHIIGNCSMDKVLQLELEAIKQVMSG